MARVLVLIALSACTDAAMTTPEGCPVMMSVSGQAYTQACQAAYYEERARQTGGQVTRCTPTANGGMSCATY